MPTEKEMLTQSIEALTDNAKDVAALADSQRVVADKLHENAHKLENVAATLDTEAALIKEKIGKPGNDPTSKRMADRLPSISPERYRRA